MSMAPASVQMVLVEGENADGVLVEEDGFGVTAVDDSDPTTLPDQVIAAILGTREGAAEAGFELSSIGVTWTDQVQASALRDALSAHRLENVMLVSAFLAATALAQSVGGAMGYERTAVLFVEPDTATLAIVETSDGSIVDVYKEVIEAETYDDALAQLTGMVYGLEEQDCVPDGVFVLGSGVDIAPIKPALESATSLRVNVAEEPATALARGAALASANAPLFASSTAALAYAQDPGTGAVDPYVVPEYLVNPLVREEFNDELAYSLVSDEDADAPTVVIETPDAFNSDDNRRRRPVLLVGSGLAVVAISAVVALEIALAIGIRTTVALQPSPNQSLIVPTQQAPTPPRVEASAPAPRISLPAPMAAPRPPVPVALPAPPPPAAPIPAAPVVPVPVAVPPILPVPVPVHLPLPNPVLRPPLIEAPPVLSPPQRLLPEPPRVRVPEPSSPPEGTGTLPHSPPHQLPPTQGLPPNPSQGVGHNPFPGAGPGGAHGGGPLGGLPGGVEPGSPPPFGGGHPGGGPFGGGLLGGGPLGGFGGGHPGGGPFGGGLLGGGPLGGFGGGHPGGGPFGGGLLGGGPLGGFGGGHPGGGPFGGGGLGGFGGGGHSFGGFGGGFGGGGHH